MSRKGKDLTGNESEKSPFDLGRMILTIKFKRRWEDGESN
jgi:hypothetical protein